jgi:hypothetical protein
MAKEIIGKCFICKREISRHDLSYTEEGQREPTARFFEGWPGDGLLCTEHHGVLEYFAEILKNYNIE